MLILSFNLKKHAYEDMNRMTQISRMTKFYFLLIFIALALCSFCHSVKKHEATRWLKKARKGQNSSSENLKKIRGTSKSSRVSEQCLSALAGARL